MIARIDDKHQSSAEDLAAIQGSWELTQQIGESASVVDEGLSDDVKRREVWTITGDRIVRRIELNE